MQAFEERTAEQFQRLLSLSCVERGPEFAGVAGQRLFAEPDLLFSSCDDGIPAERRPQRMHRLPEGIACMGVVELGPEEGDKRVAAVQAGGPSGGEVAKKRKQLGTSENGLDLAALRVFEIHSPQHSESDHTAEPFGCVRYSPHNGFQTPGKPSR